MNHKTELLFFVFSPLIPTQSFLKGPISYKNVREGNLIMSYLELVANQNKRHYQYIYEGKSNYMHTHFGILFLIGIIFMRKITKASFTVLTARPSLCQRKKAKLSQQSEDALSPGTQWQRSRLGNAFGAMSRGGRMHTFNTMETHQHRESQPVLAPPLTGVFSKGSLIQRCWHLDL